MTRRLDDAQHEAAHVVVGVALGLHLRKAVLRRTRKSKLVGYAQFEVPAHKRTAWGITLAAGVAFEQRAGTLDAAAGDLQTLVDEGFSGEDIVALVVAADAILESRGTAHARVTRALVQRDLTGEDIERLAAGARVELE